MSLRARSVSTWAIIRTTRGIEPSISSSRAQISGTSSKPSWRAAYAGNSECRSEVAVKMMLMKSSTVERVGLHHAAHHLGDPVEHVVAGVGSRAGWLPARRGRTRMSPHSIDGARVALSQPSPASAVRPGLRAGGVQQRAELALVELAQAALLQAGEPHRSDLGAGEAAYGMADVVQQPAHDPVAALVDHQLDDRAVAVGRAHLGRADLRPARPRA